MTSGVVSIARLRAIAGHLVERDDADAEWFAACLAEYEAGTRHGLTLGDAFGFRLSAGETPWWESESRADRDRLIRRIVEKWYHGLSQRAAAAALVRDLSRYAGGTWRQHCALRAPPVVVADTLRADLFWLLKAGAKITERIVRDVLASEMHVLTGQGSGDAFFVVTEAPTDGPDQIQKSA